MKRTSFLRNGMRKNKIKGHHDPKQLQACRGESCYLNVPGVCHHIQQDETVVGCHGNWSDTGKGMGLKAKDHFSVPGCALCHYWLDIETTATRDEKRDVSFAALKLWEPARTQKLVQKNSPASVVADRSFRSHTL